MLDDMRVLQDAVQAYRAAVTATGVPWPENGDRNGGLPLDALCRIFDVDHIAEQPLWLMSHGLPYERILPDGGFPLPWTDASELLDYLSASVATPFYWRHQLPLFFFEHIVYTFVLAGEHEGEIWRYQIDPDDWNPLRAAPSLAALFTQWTKGFGADMYVRSPHDSWLHVGDGERNPVDVLLESATDLDPFAFPVFLSLYSHEDVIRARQRECGVDTDRVDQFDCHEELLDAICAAGASLRG
ncbi:hypothetical protein ABZ754_00265 [Micromonospora purpureochromogenes]|uniref:hypothetical protein n=1 Tax=Micromonospora purpureochromogenes TaxID=47872 RepID=UPI0033CC1984